MTESIAEMARRRPPLSLVDDAPVVEPAPSDPDDVLALLRAAPCAEPVATGTPLDALAPDRIARRALVVLVGEHGRGKTAQALPCAATRLRAGDHVLVHVVDRDPLVACHRLARLLGCGAGELASRWPRLRVRTGDLARSVGVVAEGHTIVVDSMQAAADHVRARRDAAPHERVEAVLRELRRAALAGALVVATCERATSGDARHSHAVGYAADVLAVCDRDDAGRFSVEVTKPHGCGRRWYVLDAAGWPVGATADASAAVQVTRTVRGTRPRRHGRRAAENAPARTAAALRDDVLDHVRGHDGCTAEAVARAVRGRRVRVLGVVRELVSAGELRRDETGGLHADA
ncbi:MAG: hypothetical protein L6Q84_23555 [Polyangiaceae bacterium]|nr:hypothetical protein [Polyangiaceae bacterium]